MSYSRWLIMLEIILSLAWSGNSHSGPNPPSKSIAGTWYNSKGSAMTFKADGTINYHGKRYYYAVSNGGIIQLKGRQGEMTIPYQLSKGKLTLTEGGQATIYRRKK